MGTPRQEPKIEVQPSYFIGLEIAAYCLLHMV